VNNFESFSNSWSIWQEIDSPLDRKAVLLIQLLSGASLILQVADDALLDQWVCNWLELRSNLVLKLSVRSDTVLLQFERIWLGSMWTEKQGIRSQSENLGKLQQWALDWVPTDINPWDNRKQLSLFNLYRRAAWIATPWINCPWMWAPNSWLSNLNLSGFDHFQTSSQFWKLIGLRPTFIILIRSDFLSFNPEKLPAVAVNFSKIMSSPVQNLPLPHAKQRKDYQEPIIITQSLKILYVQESLTQLTSNPFSQVYSCAINADLEAHFLSGINKEGMPKRLTYSPNLL